MTDYVCSVLSQPDNNGLQQCQTWTQYTPPAFIPELTKSDADALIIAIISVWVVAWGARRVMRFFGY